MKNLNLAGMYFLEKILVVLQLMKKIDSYIFKLVNITFYTIKCNDVKTKIKYKIFIIY